MKDKNQPQSQTNDQAQASDPTSILSEYLDPADPSMVKVDGKKITINRSVIQTPLLEELTGRLNGAGFEVTTTLGSPN